MGASAGGYAAADVATGTEQTVMKGWMYWGSKVSLDLAVNRKSRFRAHLHSSISYVMDTAELAGVFAGGTLKKLLLFTSRVRRRDRKPFGPADRLRYFFKSATRKLPGFLKYLPQIYLEDPVIFVLNLPDDLRSEYVRPLTRANYHAAIEASCLIPLAMGTPLLPNDLDSEYHSPDSDSVFVDGGYALKMPMRLFAEDPRFQALGRWARADKTVIFCCDPHGFLWETSARLHCLNSHPAVSDAIRENRLLVIHPNHRVEAGFLCLDHATTMRTFHRGQDQAHGLLRSEKVRRFFES
jgi:hypothetical protein